MDWFVEPEVSALLSLSGLGLLQSKQNDLPMFWSTTFPISTNKWFIVWLFKLHSKEPFKLLNPTIVCPFDLFIKKNFKIFIKYV